VNRSYEITILGNKFNVKSDLDEEDVRKVEELVKKKINELQGRYSLISPLQLLTLALLNLAEENVRQDKKLKSLGEQLVSKIEQLDTIILGK